MPTIRPEPVYDRLYPYYVELCAISQIRANFAEHGGSPGHAAMYVKGACRDPATPFPTLKVCDPEASDLTDPETGTGVSVNKMLKNVNWMAIPGKRLFLFGNLAPDQVLDKETAIATIAYAERQGVFDGLEIHKKYKPPEDDREQLLYLAAAETLGTDFALNFGRTVFCSRLPMSRPMLEDVVEYLNGLNREYALGETDYNWSGYYDNCAHTLHNALAAAGVWKKKSVNSFKLRQFFNLAVPANRFANLAILSTTFPIEQFDGIYYNKVMRQTLIERNWLPARHGALLKLIPVHQNNELYDTRLRLFVLESPFLRAKSRKVEQLFDDPRFTEVERNLLYFEDRYAKILEARPADWDQVSPGDTYAEVRKRYYRYIEAQLADVKAKLEQLYSTPRVGVSDTNGAKKPFRVMLGSPS